MLQPWENCNPKKSERALKLLTHRWWAAQRERACRRRGRSMWASSRSSAGKRPRRNTEGGHRSELDTVHRAASSPAGRQSGRHRKWTLNKQDNTGAAPRLCKQDILTGQMRETRRPVVAISLSGSNRSLSWTKGNTHTHNDHVISEINHHGAAVTCVADTYCAHGSVLRSPQSTVWVGWRGLMPWRPSLNRRPPSTAAIRFRGRQRTVINTRSET